MFLKGTSESLGDSDEPVGQFAADLRRLRVEANNPTLGRLQTETGISRTVIAEAFAGRRLPSERTVGGLVRACGGDLSAWLERRDAVAGLSATNAREEEPPLNVRPQPMITRRSGLALAAATFVVGIVASTATTALVLPQVQSRGSDSPQVAANTGENPALTPCIDDAEIATAETRAEDYLLEIIWSNKCQAGWGRITRFDGLSDGNTVRIAIYPEPSPNGLERQEATEHDVQSAYTTLIVRPTGQTLLCVEGEVTIHGKRIDLGAPLCT